MTNNNKPVTRKPASKKRVKQPKPISVKEPAQKTDLAKVVGGGLIQHNETFVLV